MAEFGDTLSNRLKASAQRMGTGVVKVGFMENATYPDGTPVAAVAYWNEFGTGTQKPRPFFRRMVAKESGSWAGKLGRIMKITGDSKKALALMGEDISGALQQSINEFTTPELAQSTIAAKGFAKPLIDTGDMLRSVAYQVNEEPSVKVGG
jgi:hypothetical protein